MKNRYLGLLIVVIIATSLASISVWAENSENALKRGNKNYTDNSEKIAAAYVLDRQPEIPDPNMFTHLIYSFGVFNDSLDEAVIKYPEKLKTLSDLKKQNPVLKIILSFNDVRREGFSEMTRDKKKRKSFVKSVKEIVKSYNLDGVDLDWEFPTIEWGGHTASPEDDKNYILLVKDLRKALGKKAWISYYSNNSGNWIDHKGMLPYVTYVNVSGYNLAGPQEGKPLLHQCPLYPSSTTGDWCVSKVIKRHMDLGIPKDKILIGIPLFGRGIAPFPSYVEWSDFSKYSSDAKLKWEEAAQAPYYSDENGNLVLGFDDERSIEAKFDFIRTNELPGVFVFHYDSELKEHPLGNKIKKLRKGE